MASRLHFGRINSWTTLACRVFFSEMHDFAVNKQVSIAEVLTQHEWNYKFRRNFNDWEIETVSDFICRLEAFTGTRDEHDILWWRKKKGTFKVYSAYKLLNQDGQQPSLCPW